MNKKPHISYYLLRYIAIWCDLIDSVIAIVSFNMVFTNFGMKMRLLEMKLRTRKLS